MRLVLRDLEPGVVLAWTRHLSLFRGVSVGVGDVLRSDADALVSPANSHGFMDGGVDKAYLTFFGLGIQRRVQELIAERWQGLLPVGKAILVPTGHARFPRLVVAPTMETPHAISDTDNVYRATRAALEAALGATPPIERLAVPGMGTGVGRMDPNVAAEQMKRAIIEVLAPAGDRLIVVARRLQVLRPTYRRPLRSWSEDWDRAPQPGGTLVAGRGRGVRVSEGLRGAEQGRESQQYQWVQRVRPIAKALRRARSRASWARLRRWPGWAGETTRLSSCATRSPWRAPRVRTCRVK